MRNNQEVSAITQQEDFTVIGQGRYKVWWDEKENLFKGITIGEITEELARSQREDAEKGMEAVGKKVNCLIDLRRVTKISSPARKVYNELHKHPSIGKLAFIGTSTFIRTVLNFVLIVSGKKDAKHFATKGKALRWLERP